MLKDISMLSSRRYTTLCPLCILVTIGSEQAKWAMRTSGPHKIVGPKAVARRHPSMESFTTNETRRTLKLVTGSDGKEIPVPLCTCNLTLKVLPELYRFYINLIFPNDPLLPFVILHNVVELHLNQK